MKKIRLVILMLAFPMCLHAADFGVLLNQYGKYGNAGGENVFEYNAGIVPRFSVLFDDKNSLFVSASFTLKYKDDSLTYFPELLRTEFSARLGGWQASAGRISYSDPLSFIANGLFDGARFSYSSSSGRFGIGAWYTGFHYKDTTVIAMTADDEGVNSMPVDYSDFLNPDFAPRRLLVSADWEHPSLKEILQIKASVAGQIDLSGRKNKVHSQYLIFKFALPYKNFLFEAGGSLEALELMSDETKFNLAFAGEFGISRSFAASFNSRLSFSGKYSSGKLSDLLGAFIPVTTKYFGEIFQVKMTGLSVLSLNYSARFAESLGVSLAASYFIRNDLITPNSYAVSGGGKGGYFLGAEAYARIIWSPVSDLQFNLGGGAFIPSLGDNWPDEKLIWKVELTAVLAVF
jgi:hypothetical protein